MPILLKFLPKIKEEEMLPDTFYGASTLLISKTDDTTRKLQTNIPKEYRCKHSQQNISKPNLTKY